MPEALMRISVSFRNDLRLPEAHPVIFNLNVHFTRVSDLVGRDDS